MIKSDYNLWAATANREELEAFWNALSDEEFHRLLYDRETYSERDREQIEQLREAIANGGNITIEEVCGSDEFLDGLDTVAYYYAVGYDDHRQRTYKAYGCFNPAFGCTTQRIKDMRQTIDSETKEEREDRLIRLGCECAEELKELRKKRMTVSPEEAERLDVEFGEGYGYSNLLIMTAEDRIRLGCPKVADVPDDYFAKLREEPSE
jgi:hypothetical protein